MDRGEEESETDVAAVRKESCTTAEQVLCLSLTVWRSKESKRVT